MSAPDTAAPAPLSHLTVIEFTHMVMGPTAGVVLADLGAEVIKVEPLGGDNTRRLKGSGAGYYPMYNRNKKSLAVDLKSEAGLALVKRLVAGADVVIENFRPGAMDRMGLGYGALAADNPGLVYCSAKGFLNGPYEHRVALDEVTQMMGGLAYMTGPPGQPLRAGTSIIDIMGGMFGVIGILAALEERHRTGRGRQVTSSLYESTVFAVGQHMAQQAVTGKAPAPMPARLSAWAVYDRFDTKDGEQVFVGVVTDTQWRQFCEAFGLEDWAGDESLARNSDRVERREEIVPRLQSLFLQYTKDKLMKKLDATGLPFAPIARPEDLFDDPHLNQSEGLVPLTIPGGVRTRLPALPLALDGVRLGLRHDLTHAGQDSRAVMRAAGYEEAEIERLIGEGIVAVCEAPAGAQER